MNRQKLFLQKVYLKKPLVVELFAHCQVKSFHSYIVSHDQYFQVKVKSFSLKVKVLPVVLHPVTFIQKHAYYAHLAIFLC